MHKKRSIIHYFITSLLLIIIIMGITGKEAKAESNVSVGDIIDLSGITRNEAGAPIVKNKYVTREELAQMLVQASPYAKDAKSTDKLKLYKDVPVSRKASAYIQIAAQKGYMSGYLNGTFKPTKPATLKEAVYGMLGILGYTKDDFTGNLIDARYDKFKELGLGKNLSLNETDKLTKKDCEFLFYNLLKASQKSGDIYGKSLGFSLNEEGEIDYQALLVKKTKGPYVAEKGWAKMLRSKLSSYTILHNDKIIKASTINDNSIVYYSEEAKKIWIYSERSYGTLENITYNQGEPLEVTVAGTTYTIEKPAEMKKQLKAFSIEKGMLVTLLLGRNDKVSDLYPIKSTLADQNWQQQVSFNVKEGTIYKNSNKTDASDIQSNDMIYYSTELKTIWSFNKKVYGLLNSITSNQGEPQVLTVANTNYDVANPKEMKKILKNSSVQSGMPVVLLFGWDEKIADVLPLFSMVADGNWQSKLSFDINHGTIYKNGSTIAASDIVDADVLYYSKELETIWVYEKKVYGVVDAINPSVSAPETIVVAGKTYDLNLLPVNSTGTSSNSDNLTDNIWGRRLRENKIKVGDNVVVLFGYNGSVAEIRTVQKMPVTLAGYVLSVDNKVIKNSNQDSTVKKALKMVDTEGMLREFPCPDDTTIGKGSMIEVSFTNGETTIKELKSYADFNIPSDIASKKLAEDANILAINDQNYINITSSQLNKIRWNAGNVRYYKCNSAGDITDLIVYNVVSFFYQYGLLKDVILPDYESGILNYQFNFDLGGNASTLVTDTPLWNMNPGPKAIQVEDNKITDMKELKDVRISYISQMQANTGDAVYQIADDVPVYFYKLGKYYKGELEDIKNFSGNRVKGYIDVLQGYIRVIIVTA